MKLGGCKVGQSNLTKAYKLPSKFVIIYKVGPKWKCGHNGEKELQKCCYRKPLSIAIDNNCESVAFPLISSGVYGYPKDQALRIAVDVISSFLVEHDMLVYIVVLDKSVFQISEKLFADIASFIEALMLLTNEDSIPYLTYVVAIKKKTIARAVKLADLQHNSDFPGLILWTRKH